LKFEILWIFVWISTWNLVAKWLEKWPGNQSEFGPKMALKMA